jgi:outer membrane biosynthesis protein TonB
VIAAPPDLLDPLVSPQVSPGVDPRSGHEPAAEGEGAEGRASAGRAEGGPGGTPGSARSLRRQLAPSQVTPREIPSSEDRTRPVRPSKNLAAARAAADHESRRPTGEMPGLGHELRAKAPDHRVHTSPLGNVLPLAFMDALGGAVPDPQGPAPTPAGSSLSPAPSPARDESADEPARPSGRSERGRPERLTADPDNDRYDRYDRRDGSLRSDEQTPVRGSPGLAAIGPGSTRTQGAQAGSARTPHRAAAPVRTQEPVPAVASRPRDLDTPEPVRFEPTQTIPRPRRLQRRLLRVVRRLAWGLLWLSIGGAVAYAVAHLLCRPPASVESSPAPATRPPTAPGPQRPSRPRPATATPRARDLVVSVPPAAPPTPTPMPAPTPKPTPQPTPTPTPTSSGPAAPAAPAAATAPTAPAAAEPELTRLTPQQRAAVDQTLANIEFVASTYRAQVRACYERVARAQGSLPGGRVEMALTLGDTGLVQSVVTVENTLDLPVLSACLEQRIAEWRFPRPTGPLRTFRFPFLFAPTSPSGAAAPSLAP